MLIPLTDPEHPLSKQMLRLIGDHSHLPRRSTRGDRRRTVRRRRPARGLRPAAVGRSSALVTVPSAAPARAGAGALARPAPLAPPHPPGATTSRAGHPLCPRPNGDPTTMHATLAPAARPVTPRPPRPAPVPRNGLGRGVPVPAHRVAGGRGRLDRGDPHRHRGRHPAGDLRASDPAARSGEPSRVRHRGRGVLGHPLHAHRDRGADAARRVRGDHQRLDAAVHRDARRRLARRTAVRADAGRARDRGRGGGRARRLVAAQGGPRDARGGRGRARGGTRVRVRGHVREAATPRGGRHGTGDRPARGRCRAPAPVRDRIRGARHAVTDRRRGAHRGRDVVDGPPLADLHATPRTRRPRPSRAPSRSSCPPSRSPGARSCLASRSVRR